MIDKINEEYLCVLRYIDNSKDLALDYFPIHFHFQKELEELELLRQSINNESEKILYFFETNKEINKLNGFYKYCRKLDGTFQEFTVDIDRTKEKIKAKEIEFQKELQSNEETYKIKEEYQEYLVKLINDIIVWIKAFDIKIAYRKCYDDPNILTFSHRISGWSNPAYQLSENFIVDVKTNFGYGNSSYFFVKLKYKNIEITPLSDWINYEIAKFSEIIRYTKSFANRTYKGTYNGKRVFKPSISNIQWKEALDYTLEACNCSKESEMVFIEKYLIQECEIMVSGLENFLNNEEFQFYGENNKYYNVDKKGHYLIEFRAEKISGALDFISKIIEYKSIASIYQFIERIESMNKEIQPVIKKEIIAINESIKNLKIEIEPVNLELEKYNKQNTEFITKINDIRISVSSSDNKGLNFSDRELLVKQIFSEKNPDYLDFEKEYNIIKENHRRLIEQLNNFTIVKNNIINYEEKIKDYFENK